MSTNQAESQDVRYPPRYPRTFWNGSLLPHESQAYLSFLSTDILEHPGMSVFRHTTTESQAYLSFMSTDILGHPWMSVFLRTITKSQAFLSFLSKGILLCQPFVTLLLSSRLDHQFSICTDIQGYKPS